MSHMSIKMLVTLILEDMFKEGRILNILLYTNDKLSVQKITELETKSYK